MAFNVTYIIQAIDKFSATARRISRSTAEVTKRFKKLSETAEKFQKISRGIFTKVALPVVGLGAALFHTAAQFQDLNVSFGTLLGSKEKGEAMFKSMIGLSRKWGSFTTLEFAKAGKALVNFGGQAEQVPKVLERMANVAAAGKLNLQSIAVGYGLAFSQRTVQKGMISELIRGTTILKGLSTIMGESVPKIIKRLRSKTAATGLPFWALRKWLIGTTTPGGKFGLSGALAKGQENAAQTISGAFKLVRDSIQIAMGTTGLYLSKQVKLVHWAFKLKDAMIQLTDNFDFYVKKYAPLIKAVGLAIAGFLTMMVTTFILGTAIRFVENIIKITAGTMWLLRNAAIALRTTLIALKIIFGVLRGAIILSEIAMAPMLVVILLIVGAIVLLAWGFKKLFQWLKGSGTFAWFGNMTKLVFHAIVNAAEKNFPMLTKIIKASVQWIVNSFDWLLSKGDAVKKFLSSIGRGLKEMFPAFSALDQIGLLKPVFKKTLNATGTLTTKMLGPTGLAATKLLGPVTPMGVVSLESPGGSVDILTQALSAAFPALSEGLAANINVGISSKHDLQIDRITHSSSSPNVEVGTTMPFAAHGAV